MYISFEIPFEQFFPIGSWEVYETFRSATKKPIDKDSFYYKL